MKYFVKSVSVLGLTLFGLGGSSARASFIPDFQGTSPSGANTAFNYTLRFATNAGTEQLVSGDFVTVYDIPGLVSATAPAGFNVSIQNTGINAPLTLVPDSASLPNVTFTFTGATQTADTNFVNALITSSFSAQANGFFSGQDTNAFDVQGTKLGNAGQTIIPVPEPAGALLLGIVVAFMSASRRRRRN
jgi:hypothetical protein